MATHSSVFAWRIQEMGEPDGLPSMGSHRVGHDWSNLHHVPDTILGTGAEPDIIPFLKEKCESVSHSVVFGSLWSHGLSPTRLLCPWDFPGKNIRVISSSSSRESFRPRDQTHVSCLAGRFFTTDPPGKPHIITYLSKPMDMYNARSEPQYKLRTLSNDTMST